MLRIFSASCASAHSRHITSVSSRSILPENVRDLNRLLGAGRFQHPITVAFQKNARQFPQIRLIFRQQNRLRPPATVSLPSAPAASWLRLPPPASKCEMPYHVPTSLSTWILPPLCFTIPYTVDNPSPVPFPIGFVVKNGSKMWESVPPSIPCPESMHPQHDISSRSQFQIARGSASNSTLEVSIVSLATVRHRIARIDRQVHQHLFHLTWVRLHRHQRRMQAERSTRYPRQ